MTLNPLYGAALFQCPLKKCVLMCIRKYRKRPVPGNKLKIFSTNMSAEC